jgi:phage gpG-like protein
MGLLEDMFQDTGQAKFIEIDATTFLANLAGLKPKYMAACEQAMMKGGWMIATEASANVRKNKSVVTGNLMGSIHPQIGTVTENTVDVLIGTNLVYAKRVEYGFFGQDSLGRHYAQAPRPYLRPAFDTKKEAALAFIASEIKKTIEHSGGSRAVSKTSEGET